MPAQAALTVNDGQATPVARTFNPAGIKPEANLAIWVDRSSGQALGFGRIMISLREPAAPKNGTSSASSRMYKAVITVQVPTLETLGTNDSGLTPPPTLAYTTAFRGEFMIPERATLQNRKDILAYVKNVLALSVVTSLVQDLEPVF